MAGEILRVTTTGQTLYALIFDHGKVFDVANGVMTTYATANLGNYDIPLVEQGTVRGIYFVAVPDAYDGEFGTVIIKVQAGGSPAESDTVDAVSVFQRRDDGRFEIAWDVGTS